jgi:TRAP-type uncharacterized transport system fused permease subunit
MAVGFKSLRIGSLLLLLPVLFVLQPALILKGSPMLVLQVAMTAITAVILIAAAFEGYLYVVGSLSLVARLLIGIGGLLLLIPETYTDMAGLAFAAIGIVIGLLTRERAAAT